MIKVGYFSVLGNLDIALKKMEGDSSAILLVVRAGVVGRLVTISKRLFSGVRIQIVEEEFFERMPNPVFKDSANCLPATMKPMPLVRGNISPSFTRNIRRTPLLSNDLSICSNDGKIPAACR